MADLDFYKKNLGIATIDELSNYLCDTFIETNRTYNFFVDWNKVIKNKNAFKYEIALLKSLKNSKNAIADLKNLLRKYPEVIRVIPLLLAERESVIKVLESIDTVKYKVIDFHKKLYKSNEINLIVDFVKKSGLLDIICQMESAEDYLLGVEVGLDTNARKNRSGSFLEDLVKQSINKSFSNKKDLILLEQKFFKTVREENNIEIPLTLSDRKSDFVLILNKKALNIEVNYYGGTGSKPTEIISSYINRNQVLKASGWRFVWLTDGIGWKGMRQPLKIGLENIDYIINTNLLNKGILEKIILTK